MKASDHVSTLLSSNDLFVVCSSSSSSMGCAIDVQSLDTFTDLSQPDSAKKSLIVIIDGNVSGKDMKIIECIRHTCHERTYDHCVLLPLIGVTLQVARRASPAVVCFDDAHLSFPADARLSKAGHCSHKMLVELKVQLQQLADMQQQLRQHVNKLQAGKATQEPTAPAASAATPRRQRPPWGAVNKPKQQQQQQQHALEVVGPISCDDQQTKVHHSDISVTRIESCFC
jgi:hypothetical protein